MGKSKKMRKDKIHKRWIRGEGGCVRVKERKSLGICGERKEDKSIKKIEKIFIYFIFLLF